MREGKLKEVKLYQAVWCSLALGSPLRRWLVPRCAWLPASGTSHRDTAASSEPCLAQLGSQEAVREQGGPVRVGEGVKGKEGGWEGDSATPAP